MIRILVIVAIVLWIAPHAHAQSDKLEKTVIVKRSLTLSQLLAEFETQTQLHFSFDSKTLPGDEMINLAAEKLSVKEILEHLKREHQISHQVKDNVIILKKSPVRKGNNKTLSGVIQDGATGELLPGAEVTLVKQNLSVVSNAYGFYSISSAGGEVETIRVNAMGYSAAEFDFHFTRDSTASIMLSLKPVSLQEVTVTATATNSDKVVHADGAFVMRAEQVKDIMAFGGEPDPVKAIQFLPGVVTGTEGTANLSVRGGSYDQNLFLLDEAPVYNPTHALSFISIFNVDALQSITLHKNEIPVSYGGRLSSIINVRTRDGNRNKLSFSGAVGTLASRISVEGPLSKKHQKLSFIASGRYSYAGHVVNGFYMLGRLINDKTSNRISLKNKVDFYDLNVKINFRKDDRNHFYFSAYSGHDNFYYNRITNGYSLNWGNTTATLRWNHVHNSRLFSNTTAVYSHYAYEYTILDNTRYFLWQANFQELDVKQDYDFYLNPNNHVTFGGGVEGHRVMPGRVWPRSETAVTEAFRLPIQRPIGTYLYAGNHQTIGKKLTLKYGLRYSNFILIGPGIRYFFEEGSDSPYDSTLYKSGDVEKIYHRLEPRVSMHYAIGAGKLSLSYDRTTQYFHLLANSSVALPTDVWMPSGGTIKPQQADLFVLNYQQPLGTQFNGLTGIFYKRMDNITDFKDNANLFVNRHFESQLLQGEGTAYGAEFLLQKTAGKFTGMLSYTWSNTYHLIEGVNNNKRYRPRYDKTHNLSATGKVELSKRWELGANYVYTTGGAVTLPSGNFVFDGVVFNNYRERNGFRFPDYHRLDLSFRLTPRKNDGRRFKSLWSFDIYNVYYRKNPMAIYSMQQDHNFWKTETSAIYLFKVLPTVTYSFKF